MIKFLKTETQKQSSIPIEQSTPPYPDGQAHLNSRFLSKHKPPFLQGEDEQRLSGINLFQQLTTTATTTTTV